MKEVNKTKLYLNDILKYSKDIESFLKGMTKELFLKDIKTQDAVIRKIQIIGEIVKRLPSLLKESYPFVPWKDIAGMRDILVHEYADVDLDETWSVANQDIPKLKRQVTKILKQISEK